MAEWNKNKVNPREVNGGKEFTTNDNLAVDELNAMVNNSFYAVDFVEAMADSPDISEIDGDGIPSVSLVSNEKDGKPFKKFKFSNLKGAKGEQGERGEKGEKGESGESNSLIKYLGYISISQMLVRDLFALIEETFGTSCSTYYIKTSDLSTHEIIISSYPDGQSSSSVLDAHLTNKWTGENVTVEVQQISANGLLGVSGGTGAFDYRPYVAVDYIEIGKCSAYNVSPSRYNVRYSWAGYEINVIDRYGYAPYIKSETGAIHVYGIK